MYSHLAPDIRDACSIVRGYMAIVRLASATISDWDSFHLVCQQVFGFPDFYGMNMNAWIDCLTYVDDDDGMSRFHLAIDEQVFIEVTDTHDLLKRLPDIVAALVSSTAAVNQRQIQDGKIPRLALVFL